MKLFFLFMLFSLSACKSIRTYEEIIDSVIENYQSSDVTYVVNYWEPISTSKEVNSKDIDVNKAKEDQKLCIDEYRGKKFNDEAISIVYFMQCMNKKGWRLSTEELIVIEE